MSLLNHFHAIEYRSLVIPAPSLWTLLLQHDLLSAQILPKIVLAEIAARKSPGEKLVSTFHLINVWSDPEAAGGFNPMAHSLLWLPDGYQTGQPTPAFVFIHAWGGYPHDDLAQTLGPAIADRGYAFLSLCLRRRGGEGQLMAQT